MAQRANDYKCSRVGKSNDRKLHNKNNTIPADLNSIDGLQDFFGDESLDELFLDNNQTDRVLQHWGYRDPFGRGGARTQYPDTTANFYKQNSRERKQRNRTGTSDFNVYKLMPTKYFYSYKGSLTVPPCSTIVDWHVMDSPLIISTR